MVLFVAVDNDVLVAVTPAKGTVPKFVRGIFEAWTEGASFCVVEIKALSYSCLPKQEEEEVVVFVIALGAGAKNSSCETRRAFKGIIGVSSPEFVVVGAPIIITLPR